MASKQPDQFFDFDITKYMGDFKAPGFDLDVVMSGQKKNLEALTQANKMAYEGLQAVAKRQAEIIRQAMEEAAQVGKSLSEPGTPYDKAAKQADLAKNAFERALENARELTEMMVKSNEETVQFLNKRFTQSIDEVRDAFLKAGKK